MSTEPDDYKSAKSAIKITKHVLDIASALPVVGDFLNPLCVVFDKVLAVCDQVDGCRSAINSLQDRLVYVYDLMLRQPDGLAYLVKDKPAVHQEIFKQSVMVLVNKYEETILILVPYTKKQSFLKIYMSNASKLKASMEKIDEEIVEELKKLSSAMQVVSLHLQVQTFNIITDLQERITRDYGGQQGLLQSEEGLKKVAELLEMEVDDVRVCVQNHLAEMQQKLLEHTTEEAKAIKLLQVSQTEELKRYIQSVLQESKAHSGFQVVPSPAGSASLLSQDLESIALPHPVVTYNDPPIVLGKGEFGTVLKGLYQGQVVAVKMINTSILEVLGPVALQDLKKEVLVHHRLSEVPGVVKLYGVDLTDKNVPKVVLELAEGSLHDALHRAMSHPVFCYLAKDLFWRLDITRQISQAVSFLHNIDFLHRDIKPLNVLLFPDSHGRHGAVVKLADFGFARGLDSRSIGAGQPKGTVHYMAPEVFRVEYSKASDVYAFAILLNEILAEVIPYHDNPAACTNQYAFVDLVKNSGLRPTMFTEEKTECGLRLAKMSQSSSIGANLVASLERLIRSGWCKQAEARGSMSVISSDLSKLLIECHRLISEPAIMFSEALSTKSTAASSNVLTDIIASHKLVQREIRSLEELCNFLRTDCKLVAGGFAQSYVRQLVRDKGIFSVDMLVKLLANDPSLSSLGFVSNVRHLAMISAAAKDYKKTNKSATDELSKDENVLLDDLRVKLGLTSDAAADFSSLYKLLVFRVPMFSIMALVLCEIIATNLGFVNIDVVLAELKDNPDCIQLRDILDALGLEKDQGTGLSAVVVEDTWNAFVKLSTQQPTSSQQHEEGEKSDIMLCIEKLEQARNGSSEALAWIQSKSNDSNEDDASVVAMACVMWILETGGTALAKDHQQAVDIGTVVFPALQTRLTKSSALTHAREHSFVGWLIGVCYYYGLGVDISFEDAVRLFQASSNFGLTFAQYSLGRCYYAGNGVPKDFQKAFEWFSRAAKENFAPAQYSLGECCFNGEGVPQDYTASVDWYTKAANQNHAGAQKCLGVCFKNGHGVQQDYQQALALFAKGASQNSAACQYFLGDSWYKGQGVVQDYALALEWFIKAASNGSAFAMYSLGNMHYYGHGLDVDQAKAVEWYIKSANLGNNVHAQFMLGICYEKGKGVEKGAKAAVDWYTKAASQEHANAQYSLAGCFEHGRGVDQSYDKAAAWLVKAAGHNHTDAQTKLGNFYYTGKLGQQDFEKAFDLYTKASSQSSAEAQFMLGMCYEHGHGVLRDYSKAVEWYDKAARQGFSDSQYHLGECYFYGNGVAQNYDKAVEQYRLAADRNHADGQYRLGVCYACGYGVLQSYPDAMRWYTKAANRNHADAQYSLGVCLKDGQGASRNPAKAIEWLTKAARQNHILAQSILGDCYFKGEMVAQDYSKAVECFTAAATNSDHTESCIALGLCYSEGFGVLVNYTAAVTWFTKAAIKGSAEAQEHLGVLYYTGYGTTSPDIGKAVEWLTKAANQDQAKAQYYLGLCYEDGHGVAKDKTEAKRLYKLSAINGFVEAQIKLQKKSWF